MMENLNHQPTIVFDFGGVLLDWNPRHLYRKIFKGDEEAMERFLEEIHFMEWNIQQDAGRPFAEAVEIHCQQFPDDCDLIRAYHERWEESIAGAIQPVVEILYQLRARGYRLVALSNWADETFQQVRHQYEFMDWFEDIIISGAVKLVKPDPRIFELLLKRIQRPAEACVLIDDSRANIEVARQLGMQTIHFQSPEQLVVELGEMGIPIKIDSSK
jgi:2-haloacid dehalogenase